MLYWEDLCNHSPHQHGPFVFTSELLDHLLNLLGEKHPVHTDDKFAVSTTRKGRIIPGAFIHSFTSGQIAQANPGSAIVALRSMQWDFVRPLYPDSTFYVKTEVVSCEAISDELGSIMSTRTVLDENGKTHAIGRLNGIMLRKRQSKE